MASSRRVVLGAAVFASFVASTAACGDDDPPLESDTPAASESPPPPPDAGISEQPPGLPQVECAVGAAIEIENNDTPQTATDFTALTFCGVLSTPSDVDYATFETPAGTKLTVFQAVIDGKVDFELTLNGQTFGPAETTKFGSGRYLVKAFTKSDKPGKYRIRVQFD